MLSVKEMRPIIPVALIAHHAPTLVILCSGSWWVKMRYFADLYALFSQLTYSLTEKELG